MPSQAFVRIPLSDIFPPTKESPTSPGLLVMDTTQDPPIPVPIKLGDINQDGFPDLVAILATGSGSHRPRTPHMVMSVPCAKGVAGCSGALSKRERELEAAAALVGGERSGKARASESAAAAVPPTAPAALQQHF